MRRVNGKATATPRRTNARTVDEYLASVPAKARATLQKLRSAIRAAAPEAVEVISYQIPTFRHCGSLVAFAAFRDHCSFFVMSPPVMDAHRARLKPYDTAKATIHFPVGRPLPAALVKRLVKARIEENESRAADKKPRASKDWRSRPMSQRALAAAILSALMAASASSTARAQARLSPIGHRTGGAAAPQSKDDRQEAPAQVSPADKTPGTVRSKDGTSIAFERSGSGDVVILVSGALSTRAGNARLAAFLAPHFSVINYDRRGRGGSGDTAPYAVEREVEDIEALIDHAGGKAFVFGASSGAALALEATSRLPAKIAKAALFEPPFIVDASRPPVPEGFVARIEEMVSAGERGDAVEYFMTVAVGVPSEAVAGMRQSPMWAGLERVAHTLVYDGTIMGDTLTGKPLPARRWASATVPTLVIDGGLSDAWLHNGAAALAGVLPDARRHTIDGQDHSAVYAAPQTIAPVLIEFFRPREAG